VVSKVKFNRISESAKQLYLDQGKIKEVSEILQGILEARSPRLREIAAEILGNEGAWTNIIVSNDVCI
jgi:hypothetical protein